MSERFFVDYIPTEKKTHPTRQCIMCCSKSNSKGKKEAQDLIPRSYGGTCDPYLILQLVRDKGRKRWSKSSCTTLYEFRTSSKKKTQHPIFKETFIMEVNKGDLKDGALKIAAFDNEKYANDSELGEITIPLKELSFGRNGEENNTTRDFVEPRKECGEILFGLSYLPTAERLTFNLTKAHNLKVTAENLENFGSSLVQRVCVEDKTEYGLCSLRNPISPQ
ncbi:synaptotagmin-1 [Trichonephila clavipes]|nr:synaptotagmin-1 [Trichonephila clavipes]